MDTLDFIKLRLANYKRSLEWTNGERVSLSFRGNELAGETGEACNELKKLDRERMGWAGSRTTIQKIKEELADVVICVDLIAMELGLDLGGAVQEKFNITSDKYGLSVKL